MPNNLDDQIVPQLKKYARLQFDETRNRALLLLPERVVELNETAYAILQQCDGSHTVAEIVLMLEEKFTDSDVRADSEEFLIAASKSHWLNLLTAEMLND